MKNLVKTKQTDIERAEALMTKFALMNQCRQDLLNSVMEEVKGYEKGIKEAQLELIVIGERNKQKFVDNNLHLKDGYLHIANNAQVVTGRKFDLKTFAEARPDWIDVELKLKHIKAAWMDKEQNKELRGLGVTVDTEQSIEVKLNKPKA